MSLQEFLIELIRSYIEFLGIIVWPAITLIVLVAVWMLFSRISHSISPGRRVPITWKGMHTLLSNLETQLLSYEATTPEEHHRQEMVKHELKTAREAAERRDHHAMIQSIATLTQMAGQNDQQAQQWNINPNQLHTNLNPSNPSLPDENQPNPG